MRASPASVRARCPPRSSVSRFAEDIERDIVERLVPRYWHQAQAEASIDPLMPPEIEEVKELPARRAARPSWPWSRPGRRSSFATPVTSISPDPSSEPGGLEIDDAVEDLRKRIWPNGCPSSGLAVARRHGRRRARPPVRRAR